jgi:hypothetical protein
MKTILCSFLLMLALPLAAQSASPPDPWKALSFLEGTWAGDTQGKEGVSTSGTYTFRRELGDHILARHVTNAAGCKGPATFDCGHSDLLYVYTDAPGQPLKAIFFDNEGHVIHYDVSAPDAATAVFLSEASKPGPRFRLTYHLKGTVMSGNFEMQMPGQTDWKTYLEWSGPKQS